MKTLDRSRVYRRGLAWGAVTGVLLGAALAGACSWRLSVANVAGGSVEPWVVVLVVALAGLGVMLGVIGGLIWAALTATVASGESRDFIRHAAPPTVFPGLFGNPGANPFDDYKARIEAEETGGDDPAPAVPARTPDACPSCGKTLESDEPIAYCYHCGGALVP